MCPLEIVNSHIKSFPKLYCIKNTSTNAKRAKKVLFRKGVCSFFCKIESLFIPEELQGGRRVRRGDHLPPQKYIRNTSTCGTTPTEHLLNAGRRTQTSQKARNSPRTWVGQKKKKNRDKRIGTGMGPAPVGGSCEGGKVSTH